jgi:hypothetical protein
VGSRPRRHHHHHHHVGGEEGGHCMQPPGRRQWPPHPEKKVVVVLEMHSRRPCKSRRRWRLWLPSGERRRLPPPLSSHARSRVAGQCLAERRGGYRREEEEASREPLDLVVASEDLDVAIGSRRRGGSWGVFRGRPPHHSSKCVITTPHPAAAPHHR